MKKTLKLFGLVALSAFVFSCTKEADTQNNNDKPETTVEESGQPRTPAGQESSNCLLSFGADIVSPFDTKAVIDLENKTVSFEAETDKVLVVNGADNKTYVYNGSSFVAESEPVSLEGTIYAYYPASAYSVDAEGNVTFTMPEYLGSLEDIGDKAPMAGVIAKDGDDYKASFKNVASILEVGITGNRTLSSVELRANQTIGNGSAFSIGWNGEDPTMDFGEGATKSVTVNANVQLSDTTPAKFYFIVPAGINLTGVNVKANLESNDAGGRDIFYLDRGDWNATRNKIYKMSFYAGLFSGGAGTKENPYKIANARDFKYISKYCAPRESQGGYGSLEPSHFLGAHYQQTADIDFKDANLSTYMIASASAPFTGTYDGDNKALSNFTITGAANYTGLWRYADGATFSDILIQGATLTSDYQDTGIIAGRADNSTVSNCIATTTTVSGSDQRTGGLFGMVEGGSLTGCIFGAETDGASDGSSVTGNGNTGGLVGICNSNMTDCSNIKATVNGGSGTANGGVAGSVRAAVTLTNCTNSGNVNASKDYNGGVVGYATVAACTLDGCSNSGNVTAGTGNKYIGGVVGMINCAGVSISNCTNSGDVSKGYDIGGIVGYVSENITITECENSGKISAQNTANNSAAGGIVGLVNGANATIILCDNVGSVTATRANTGGIVGEIPGGKIDRCTNQADVKISDASQNNVGGIGGYVHGTTYIKRCYSSKVTITGGTRIGGIVGNLIDASQVVNCAVFSQIRGARTGKVGNFGIGTIAGCQGGTSLIANCLARDNGVHVQNTESDTQLAGGIVGWRETGTLQNCYTAGVLNNIRSKSKNGPALGAYVGQICGKSTGGTIKDCYYRGHTYGARALGTASSNTNTDYITCVSVNTTTGYSYGLVPVEVTTSTGTTFAAGTAYLKDLLNAGLTAGGIDGYTPETGEEMTWTDNLLGSGYAGYPVPSALANLGSKFYNE